MFDTDRAFFAAGFQAIAEALKLGVNLHKADVEKRTRNLAYSLWEEAGRPEGDGQEFWYKAEQMMEGSESSGNHKVWPVEG